MSLTSILRPDVEADATGAELKVMNALGESVALTTAFESSVSASKEFVACEAVADAGRTCRHTFFQEWHGKVEETLHCQKCNAAITALEWAIRNEHDAVATLLLEPQHQTVSTGTYKAAHCKAPGNPRLPSAIPRANCRFAQKWPLRIDAQRAADESR